MIYPERVMTVAVNRDRMITEARGKRNALPSIAAANRHCRLSRADEMLLRRGHQVLLRWATDEGIRLPTYLFAGL
jgi:hypothetical protein